jgi:hypothetical protein
LSIGGHCGSRRESQNRPSADVVAAANVSKKFSVLGSLAPLAATRNEDAVSSMDASTLESRIIQ